MHCRCKQGGSHVKEEGEGHGGAGERACLLCIVNGRIRTNDKDNDAVNAIFSTSDDAVLTVAILVSGISGTGFWARLVSGIWTRWTPRNDLKA